MGILLCAVNSTALGLVEFVLENMGYYSNLKMFNIEDIESLTTTEATVNIS